ncbi:DUF2059 domain-containing protein [Persicimonas caeni]|uniref:DUF2059 domain-containing protein n=1 Tax=Persicimonas caeni TaxID=2292766 RepID=UPI00143D3592|nr:DUF2059 domain-containing protein [Persicimonas caeni]
MVVTLMVLALSLAGVACDSSKSESGGEATAESSPAVEEEASAEGEKAQEEEASADEEGEKADSEAESAEAAEAAESGESGGKGESAKRKDIRKLLEITGSAELGLQVVDQMIAQFKMSAPNVPSEFWDEFRKDINKDGLVEIIVPIYDKHLTHDEIKALIKFFESPAGKSYVKKLPIITRESQMAGQKWGREIAQKVQKRLQEKGYK